MCDDSVLSSRNADNDNSQHLWKSCIIHTLNEPPSEEVILNSNPYGLYTQVGAISMKEETALQTDVSWFSILDCCMFNVASKMGLQVYMLTH